MSLHEREWSHHEGVQFDRRDVREVTASVGLCSRIPTATTGHFVQQLFAVQAEVSHERKKERKNPFKESLFIHT